MQYVLNFLQGLQEQVVSVLVSLRPDDKEGKLAFRASDYGLTEQDKELRAKVSSVSRLVWPRQHQSSSLRAMEHNHLFNRTTADMARHFQAFSAAAG